MASKNSTDIESPCIQLCVVDTDSGLCIGCGRNRDEIGGWLTMSPEKRRAIMIELPQRLKNITRNRRRKGGARSRRSPSRAD